MINLFFLSKGASHRNIYIVKRAEKIMATLKDRTNNLLLMRRCIIRDARADMSTSKKKLMGAMMFKCSLSKRTVDEYFYALEAGEFIKVEGDIISLRDKSILLEAEKDFDSLLDGIDKPMKAIKEVK